MKLHRYVTLGVLSAALMAGALACDRDEPETPADNEASTDLSVDALAGTWELDPTDRKEFIRLYPSGDFGGTVTFNGLVTADNPADTYSDVAGKWELSGITLTFYVTETNLPELKDKVVTHRIIGMTPGILNTQFEGDIPITIYRR